MVAQRNQLNTILLRALFRFQQPNVFSLDSIIDTRALDVRKLGTFGERNYTPGKHDRRNQQPPHDPILRKKCLNDETQCCAAYSEASTVAFQAANHESPLTRVAGMKDFLESTEADRGFNQRSFAIE
mgnify:CR=1 FL=1